jgi:hypothetical protein
VIIWGALRSKGWQGALEVGTSGRTIRLFTIEVTLDETMGNWYHFIKPILRIKNLLTMK